MLNYLERYSHEPITVYVECRVEQLSMGELHGFRMSNAVEMQLIMNHAKLSDHQFITLQATKETEPNLLDLWAPAGCGQDGCY